MVKKMKPEMANCVLKRSEEEDDERWNVKLIDKLKKKPLLWFCENWDFQLKWHRGKSQKPSN